MATITSTTSGLWSAGSTWVGGVAPGNDDAAVIAAGHAVDFDIDSSGWALGLRSLTINGGATPGMLRVDSTTLAAGTYYLKIQSGYTLLGTTSTNRGRLLANSDGVWGNSGSLANDRRFIIEFLGTAGTAKLDASNLDVRLYCTEPTVGCPGLEWTQASVDTGTDTITITPISANVPHNFFEGKMVRVKAVTAVPGGLSANTTYYVKNPSGSTFQLAATPGGSAINLTDSGTGQVDYYEYTPGAVRTYGQIFAGATVDAGADTLTYAGIAAATPNNTLVRVSAGSGALPAELAADTDYWVVSASTNTIKLAATSGGSAINLSAGGPINIHVGMYANWGVSGNTLTKTTHGLANGTAVCVRTTGVLPTPLRANVVYYVVSAAANAISLAGYSGGATITLGGSPSGTLDVYTGSTGASPNIGGTNPYTSAKMSVLDDVTGDSVWSTTSERNRIVLVDYTTSTEDVQETTLSTIAAGALTLAANVDSAQYPNALIVLVNRNITIRSATTTGTYIVDHMSSTFTGNVFNCELYGTAAARNGYGYGGTGGGVSHTFGGTIWGVDYGVVNGTSHNITATIACCNRGISAGTSYVVSGNVFGCNSGLNGSVSHTVSGNVFGCNNAISSGTWCLISGNVFGCNNAISSGTACVVSGNVFGCQYSIYSGTTHTLSGNTLGCHTGCYSAGLCLISGNVFGCSNGVRYGSVFLNRATFSGNLADLNAVDYLEGVGASLGSTSQQSGSSYRRTVVSEWSTNVIYDMADAGTLQLGHIKAWTPGGVMTTVTGGWIPASPPVSLDYCYKMIGEVATRQVFVDIPLWGKKDTALTISIYEKCDSNPSTFTAGPVFEIIDPSYEWGHAAAILDSVSAQADGGDDTSWHTLSLSYTPIADRPLILRARMTDAAKIVYWMFAMTGGYGGGAAGGGISHIIGA